MSAIVGERDNLIMNTVPRYAVPIDRALLLTPSATMFEVSLGGLPTPATITFSSLMLGAVGEIAFSSDPAVPLTVANGNAVLKFEDMTSSIVTVTASTVIEGIPYVARQTVAKQQALDLRPPPAPTGLATAGQPAAIRLNWDAAPANYANLDYTEIWRAAFNEIAQAAPVGRADGREFTDPVGPGKTLYYWIRYVSRAAIPGPFNNSTGTVGASAAEVGHLLQVLTGQITESQLYADLGSKIDLIVPTRDAVADLEALYGDTASAAASAAQAVQAAADAALKAAAADAAAGGASQYASQASQSATNASTAAGSASTSAGQSSQAATVAGGSAAAAESAASTAANAAGAAGASASAASISKEAAAGAATAAGVQAAASSQSAIEAKAARDAAGISASAALQSAGSASSSSSAAGDAASQAATSATLAVGAKNTATGAAASASQSAGAAGAAETNAAGSASQAANSAQLAAESRNAAGGFASAASTSAQSAGGSATAAGQSAAAASSAAATAGTAAGQAGAYLQQVAQSATNADGSAQAAASYLQQSQALLADPITGLQASYAAVRVTADATASSMSGVLAKYGVQLDADNVAGGFQLIAGGGRLDFAVRASAFSIAAPAGSGIASAVPFIVRTTETVVDGVTIPIGTYIANAFIQNASITNAKIGGDIYSSNWQYDVSGWYLQRSGNLFANSVRLRGNIAGGAYTQWSWPAAGTSGFYLGPEGLLLGNSNNGKFFQVTSGGDVYSTGFSIVNGRANFSGNVNTGMGAGFRIEMGPDDPVYAMWAGAGTKNDTNAIFYLKRSGAGYFGGALSAGILRTSVTNPTLDANSQVTDGPFGTNGGPITVVCSYSYNEAAGRDGGTYSASGPENEATIRLYRTIRDSTEELVQTFSVTGATYIQNNGVFDEMSFYQRVIEGSITYTDTAGGSQDRTFRAVLVTRSLRTITFNPMPGGIGQSMSNIRQSLTLISTE